MSEELRKSFNSGKSKTFEWRKETLEKLKSAILSYREKIYEALDKDLKQTLFISWNEVNSIVREIDYFLPRIKLWKKSQSVPKITMTEDIFSKAYIHKEPYGAVLIIGPWNYPFSLVFRPLIGAIAAGNLACVKPSEISENSSKLINEIISKTFDKNEICCVEGGEKETIELLSQKWDYIFFTGSTSNGKKIMSAAAVNLTPVTLELGGKSPVIIEKSANLQIAAKRIVFGKFMNVGQSCTSPDHIWVTPEIKDKFIKELIHSIEEFYQKNPKQSKEYSRIINANHHKRLVSILDKEKDNIIYGGSFDEKDNYIEPTILDNITTQSPCMQTEIFGPIIPILTYEFYKDLIPILQKEKPLVTYLFTENESAIKYLEKKTSSGAITVNDTMTQNNVLELPFGGVGESGMGKYHGKKSFDTFSHEKSIYIRDTLYINDISLRYPPFDEEKIKKIERLDFNVSNFKFLFVSVPILGIVCYKFYEYWTKKSQ